MSEGPIRIPGKAAVLSTTGKVNVHVPALYCVGLRSLRCRGGPNTYHVYMIRVRNHHGLTPSYGARYVRKVIIRARDPHIVGTQGAMVRLVLSGRPTRYLAYDDGKRYRLRTVTRSLKVHRVHCGNRVSAFRVSHSPSVIHGVGGYVVYHHYRAVYGGVRAIKTLATIGQNFGTTISATFRQSVTNDAYSCYNRYMSIYPMGTLDKQGARRPILSTLTSPSGVIVTRATPTIHATLKHSFKCRPKALMANGVISTLHELNFSCIFSASFTTSLAVVRRKARLLRQVKGCLGNSRRMGVPLVADYYPK